MSDQHNLTPEHSNRHLRLFDALNGIVDAALISEDIGNARIEMLEAMRGTWKVAHWPRSINNS